MRRKLFFLLTLFLINCHPPVIHKQAIFQNVNPAHHTALFHHSSIFETVQGVYGFKQLGLDLLPVLFTYDAVYGTRYAILSDNLSLTPGSCVTVSGPVENREMRLKPDRVLNYLVLVPEKYRTGKNLLKYVLETQKYFATNCTKQEFKSLEQPDSLTWQPLCAENNIVLVYSTWQSKGFQYLLEIVFNGKRKEIYSLKDFTGE